MCGIKRFIRKAQKNEYPEEVMMTKGEYSAFFHLSWNEEENYNPSWFLIIEKNGRPIISRRLAPCKEPTVRMFVKLVKQYEKKAF